MNILRWTHLYFGTFQWVWTKIELNQIDLFVGTLVHPKFNGGFSNFNSKIPSWRNAGWWLNQPTWKTLVKLEVFPNVRGENKRHLKPPPSFGRRTMKQFNFNIFFVWGWHPCFARYPPWQNFPRNFNQFPSRVFRFLVPARHKSRDRPLPTGFSPLPVVVWAKVVVRKVFLQGNHLFTRQRINPKNRQNWNLSLKSSSLSNMLALLRRYRPPLDHCLFKSFFSEIKGVIRFHFHSASKISTGHIFLGRHSFLAGLVQSRKNQKPQGEVWNLLPRFVMTHAARIKGGTGSVQNL